MITMLGIKEAVVSILKSNNPGINGPYGSEIKKGFIRPCFFVQIMPISSEIATKNYSENVVTVEIMYFSSGGTDLENVKMHDTLSSLFSVPLIIGDRKILPRNIRSEVVDDNAMGYNSMSFKFDLNYYNEIPNNKPAPETMSKLTLNLKGGN